MHEPPESYLQPSPGTPDDQPAWLMPLVIAGGTAVVILALVVVVAAWGLARRRKRPAVPPDPPRVAQRVTRGETSNDQLLARPADVTVSTPAVAVEPVSVQERNSSDAERNAAAPAPSSRIQEAATSPRRAADVQVASTSPGSASTSNDAERHESPAIGVAFPDDRERTPSEAPAVSAAPSPQVAGGGAASGGSAIETRLRTVSRPTKPDAGTLEAANRRLTDTLDGGARRATTRAEKRSMAESLLDRADDQQDLGLQYAMLDRARSLAIEAGDIRLPFAAIQRIERSYEMESLPLKIETLEQLAAGVETGHDRLRLAQLASDLGHQAADADEFEAARTLVDMGLNFARAIQDAQLQRTLAEQSAQLAAETDRWQVASDARKQLLQDVDDPDANQILGKYLCFVKGDWDTGLAHLVQARDAGLSELAERDVSRPTKGEDVVSLADAWYEWGRGAEGVDQHGAWSRAQGHYLDARPEVTGSLRRTVNERLEELERALDGGTSQSIRVVRLPWLDGPVGQIQTYDGHTENITALAVSMSGNLLASASEDRSVRLWQLPTGKQIWQHSSETGNLNGVAITPDERFVISNHDNNQLVVLRTSDGKPAFYVPTSARSPTDLAVSPDGQSLIWAARSRPPNMLVWSLMHNRPLAKFGDGDHPSVLDISSDGRSIVTGDSRGAIRLWDTAVGVALRDLAVHQDAITDIDLSPGGKLVASATFDKINVHDLKTGERVFAFDAPSVRTIVFSPDGLRLIAGGFREEVLMWDLASGQQLASVRAERAFSDRQILRIVCLPDPRGLVTGATDGKIRLWRLPD